METRGKKTDLYSKFQIIIVCFFILLVFLDLSIFLSLYIEQNEYKVVTVPSVEL